jgi:hypothetical protein
MVELEALEAIVQELLSLQADVVNRAPTVREQTAAAAFLAQFYNGVVWYLRQHATSTAAYPGPIPEDSDHPGEALWGFRAGRI